MYNRCNCRSIYRPSMTDYTHSKSIHNIMEVAVPDLQQKLMWMTETWMQINKLNVWKTSFRHTFVCYLFKLCKMNPMKDVATPKSLSKMIEKVCVHEDAQYAGNLLSWPMKHYLVNLWCNYWQHIHCWFNVHVGSSAPAWPITSKHCKVVLWSLFNI